MIAVLQRVTEGSVHVDGEQISEIGHGLVILLGVLDVDDVKDSSFLVEKISGFRIFNDDKGKMNLSIKDVSGEILVISQFTLCGDWLKGRRPSFIRAASPQKGNALYLDFINKLRENNIHVRTGEFGAAMNVRLVNDGPVTFVLDSKKRKDRLS